MSLPSDHTAHVERTVLSWRRTGLALFALSVGAAKAGDLGDAAVVAFLGVGVGLATLVVVLGAERRVSAGSDASAWSLLAASAGLCGAVALVGALLALVA